jgi:tripartite-type tricarboxylate transporter receptor subunit TctC
MSAAQIAYWDRVLAKLVQTAEWKKDLQDNIFEDTYRASATTERYMQAEYEQFRAALAELGMAKQ